MKIKITKRIRSKSMSAIRICFVSLPLSQISSLNLNPPWNCRRSPLSVSRGLTGSSPRLLDQLLEYHQGGGPDGLALSVWSPGLPRPLPFVPAPVFAQPSRNPPLTGHHLP